MFGDVIISADRCVTGNLIVINSAMQEIHTDFSSNQSYNQKNLRGKLALGVDAKIFGVHGDIDMFTSTQETTKTTTVLMTYQLTAKEILLTNVHGIPEKKSALCGDQFVSARQLGARLYIAYTFYFENEIKKKNFTRNVTVSLFFGLFKKSFSKPKLADQDIGDVKVSIKAWQFGGDPEVLSGILANNTPNQCTYKNLEKCATNLRDLSDYAQNDFVKQINLALANKDWDKLDARSVKLSSYDDLDIYPQSPDDAIMKKMTERREEILNKIHDVKDKIGIQDIGKPEAKSGGDFGDLERQLINCSTYSKASLCLQ